jgi:hypothetical protein
MDSGLAAVVAGLIALVAGLAGGFLAGKQQSTLEYEKWLRSRSDDLAKEARLAVSQIFFMAKSTVAKGVRPTQALRRTVGTLTCVDQR